MHIKDTNKNWSLAATTWYNMVELLSEPGMTRDANGVKRLPMIRHAMVGQSRGEKLQKHNGSHWIWRAGSANLPCSHGFHNRLALKNSGAETVPDTEHRSSKLPCKNCSLWLKRWFTVSFSRTPSCGIWAWYQRDACLGSSRWTNRRKPALQRPETCEWRSPTRSTSALRHDKINKKLCRKESQLCCYPSYPFAHVIFTSNHWTYSKRAGWTRWYPVKDTNDTKQVQSRLGQESAAKECECGDYWLYIYSLCMSLPRIVRIHHVNDSMCFSLSMNCLTLSKCKLVSRLMSCVTFSATNAPR